MAMQRRDKALLCVQVMGVIFYHDYLTECVLVAVHLLNVLWFDTHFSAVAFIYALILIQWTFT